MREQRLAPPFQAGNGRSAHVFAALLLAACVLGAACAPDAPRRPNVVLISIDTLRADRLSCYGHTRETSPHLDRLASEGALFEFVVAPTSWTLPSHMTMLTGLPISCHGACDERLWWRKDAAGAPLEPPLRGYSVAEALQGAGYRTGGFFTFEFLERQFGFGQGFETWERCGHTFESHPEVRAEVAALRQAGDLAGLDALKARHPELFEARRRTSGEVVDHAAAWLEQRAAASYEPFFLFVHLFDVHDPYTPPPGFDLWSDPAYAGPVDGTIDNSRNGVVGHLPSAADRERMLALYDGGVRYVDSEVGRLLARLDALGLDEDTLVIVTSDHGEEFWEHGDQTHHRQLYVESLHVPLIVRWPGRVRAGQRVPALAGLMDVAPTIAAAASVRPLGPMVGVDLFPILRGEQRETGRMYLSLLHRFERGPPRSPAQAGDAAETIEHSHEVGLFRARKHAILTHCPDQDFRGELYDLDRDPRELGVPEVFGPDDPLGRDLSAQIAALAANLRSIRARHPPRGSGLPEVTPKIRRMLAVTGYDGGSEVSSSASERLCLDGCLFSR